MAVLMICHQVGKSSTSPKSTCRSKRLGPWAFAEALFHAIAQVVCAGTGVATRRRVLQRAQPGDAPWPGPLSRFPRASRTGERCT